MLYGSRSRSNGLTGVNLGTNDEKVALGRQDNPHPNGAVGLQSQMQFLTLRHAITKS